MIRIGLIQMRSERAAIAEGLRATATVHTRGGHDV